MNIIIDFPLPFKIPIKNGTTIISSYSIADLKLTFNQVQYSCMFKGDNECDESHYELTIVKVEYSPNNSLKDETDVNEIFHYAVINSLEYLNHFLDAFRNIFELRDITTITITDLPMTIDVEFSGKSYKYVTHPQELVKSELEVDKEGVNKVLSLLATWDLYPEIETVERFFSLAKYHLTKEQFVYAIIELQTSFEVFIRNTHRLVLTKNGVADEEILRLSGIPFRNVIEQHLSKYLKVNLDFDKEGLIKNWYENLYEKRNQIVHLGQSFISGNQAYNAYDSYVSARNYLCDCLIKEGYLSSTGKIDLKAFTKNLRENHDDDLIVERLKEKGFIPKDIQNEKN